MWVRRASEGLTGAAASLTWRRDHKKKENCVQWVGTRSLGNDGGRGHTAKREAAADRRVVGSSAGTPEAGLVGGGAGGGAEWRRVPR